MLAVGRVNYSLEFCGGASYATFVSGVKTGVTRIRLCYLGIEGLRAYVNLDKGVPVLDYFRREGRVWTRVSRVPRTRPLNLGRMLHDLQGFESELAETFFYAYPRAEENWYERLPNHREIMSILRARPTASSVKDNCLICAYDDTTAVDDADGVATITCDDGNVCVPFNICRGEKIFQMDRALFHADSKMLSITESFFDKCFAVKSRLQSLTFSGVMSKVEKLMP